MIKKGKESQVSRESCKNKGRKTREIPLEREPKIQDYLGNSSPSLGGLGIVDKNYEPLDVARKVYNNKVTKVSKFVELLEKLKQCPNHGKKKVRQAIHQQLVHDTQVVGRSTCSIQARDNEHKATPKYDHGSFINRRKE